jgi:hypothetical protein
VGEVLAQKKLDLPTILEDAGLDPGSHDGVNDSFPDVTSPAMFGSCHS